jgi:hypothetical protein
MLVCAEKSNFTRRVVNSQKLIFTSYCAVLLHVGNAKDTVYAMMERYLGRIYDAKARCLCVLSGARS